MRKPDHAGNQATCRSSSINDPGPKLFLNFSKEKQKERKLCQEGLVETGAAVEIDKGSLRRLFLNDFHRYLKKPAQKTLRLFHRYHNAPDGGGCLLTKKVLPMYPNTRYPCPRSKQVMQAGAYC